MHKRHHPLTLQTVNKVESSTRKQSKTNEVEEMYYRLPCGMKQASILIIFVARVCVGLG